MQLPVDQDEWGIAAAACVYGWGGGYLAAIWLALPPLAQFAIQGLITLALGIGALTAQHFWRRYLRRRWPDEPTSGEKSNP